MTRENVSTNACDLLEFRTQSRPDTGSDSGTSSSFESDRKRVCTRRRSRKSTALSSVHARWWKTDQASMDRCAFPTSACSGGTGPAPSTSRAERTPPSTWMVDRKSTRLNSSHSQISYAVFCLKKKDAFSRRGSQGRARQDVAHPPDDRQAFEGSPEHRGDADDVQRRRHDRGDRCSHPLQGSVREEARHPLGLHGLLREGLRARSQGRAIGQRQPRWRGFFFLKFPPPPDFSLLPQRAALPV